MWKIHFFGGEVMTSLEELLKPVSDGTPCGTDLSEDGSLQEFETLARGKPETQFSAAEPPDWKEVRARSLELFGRSKDLRIVMTLSVALLELEGLPGFRDSLALLKGLLERYWATVHPQLDPSDSNDPLQRMNIIASLAMPVGTFGDPLRILERLRAAPLCDSVQMGRYGLADILRAEGGVQASGGKPAATMPQIEAAFRDSNPEQLRAIYQTLTDSTALVRGIDDFITGTVGAASAPDLGPLSGELVAMQKRVAPYLPAVSVSADRDEAAAGRDVPGQTEAPVTGDIRSRADVVRMLGKICDYYAQVEPSSPVPLVLKRAARLAEMDFMQIVKDLAPDAVSQVRGITGGTEEG